MEISEKVAYLKGLAEGLNLDTDSKEGKLIAAIIDVLLRLGATEVNLLDHKLGGGALLTVLVLVGSGLALALHKSRAALAEILANELCRFTPCHEIQPIGSPPAILTDIVPVNGHAKAGDCQAALCGPHFRISSEAALKCAIIQHWEPPEFQGGKPDEASHALRSQRNRCRNRRRGRLCHR